MTAAIRKGNPLRAKPKWNTQRYSTLKASFRSGLEEKIAKQISAAGFKFAFEKYKLPYLMPEKTRHYTCDFILPNGILVETKGLFTTQDRQKHRRIKELYPDLDLRFVFSNANARIAKKSPTTYSKWCEGLGIQWAHRDIPLEWLSEPTNLRSVAAMKQYMKPKG